MLHSASRHELRLSLKIRRRFLACGLVGQRVFCTRSLRWHLRWGDKIIDPQRRGGVVWGNARQSRESCSWTGPSRLSAGCPRHTHPHSDRMARQPAGGPARRGGAPRLAPQLGSGATAIRTAREPFRPGRRCQERPLLQGQSAAGGCSEHVVYRGCRLPRQRTPKPARPKRPRIEAAPPCGERQHRPGDRSTCCRRSTARTSFCPPPTAGRFVSAPSPPRVASSSYSSINSASASPTV